MHLRPFVTSTLRGAWGTPFQRMARLTRKQKHEGCVLCPQYPYGVFFEPAPPPQSKRLAHYSAIPRSYVLNASALLENNLQPADTFSSDVAPIRHAVRHLPYFICLSRSLENAGLGGQQQDGYERHELATVKGYRTLYV